jgi:hypothetical protein
MFGGTARSAANISYTNSISLREFAGRHPKSKGPDVFSMTVPSEACKQTPWVRADSPALVCNSRFDHSASLVQQVSMLGLYIFVTISMPQTVH